MIEQTLANVSFSIAKECYGINEDKLAPDNPAKWIEYEELETLHPIEVVRRKQFAPDQRATADGFVLEPWVKCPIKPLLDEPLRDPWICRADDGRYLLCGTESTLLAGGEPDFRDTLRIRLWHSTDCVNWQLLCVAWDIGDPATCRHPDRTANDWTRWSRFDGKRPARGIRAPRIHCLRGTYWITFSLCESGSGILKSLSGKPEGPYEHAGLATGLRPENPYSNLDTPPSKTTNRLTTRSGTPSLFEDTDGSVHAVWDEGWIARLDDDLAALAERPRLLQVEPESPLEDYPLTCGRRGAAVFRMCGRYVLVAEDVNPRMGGNACHDTFCAVADSLHGPYSRRSLLVPHGGAAGLFQDDTERWFAVCAGHPEDRFARCPNRAVIVPLCWDRGLDLPYRRLWTVTEAGPISTLKPVLDTSNNRPIEIRDPQALLAGDGFYYVAGTHRRDANGLAGVRLWRSSDLDTWEPVRSPSGDDFVWKVSESSWAGQKVRMKYIAEAECRQWGAQPFEHNGTFYIPFMIWPLHQSGILRSVSGKPEGPYEETGFHFKDGSPHLFRDDDGRVWIYFCFGPTRVAPLNDDLSGFAGELADVIYQNDHQQGYEGAWILKFAGKYILFQSDTWGQDKLQWRAPALATESAGKDRGDRGRAYLGYGTYDWMYSVSDHIRGPYGPPRLAVPHGGTCSVIKDKRGNWRASVFGGDGTAPFACSLGFTTLHIEAKDGDIVVRVAENAAQRQNKESV